MIQNETSLYARFLLLSQTYELIPPSLVTIPESSEENSQSSQESP